MQIIAAEIATKHQEIELSPLIGSGSLDAKNDR
jgi:hypothetical protein